MWIWVPRVNSSPSKFIIRCGYLFVNKSMFVFVNVVSLFGFIVDLYLSFFIIWCHIKIKRVKKLRMENK